MPKKERKTSKGHPIHRPFVSGMRKAHHNRFRPLHTAARKLQTAKKEEVVDEDDLTEALEDAKDTAQEFTEDLKADPIGMAKQHSEMFLRTSSELLGSISSFIQSSPNVSPQLQQTLKKVFSFIDEAIKMLLGNLGNIFKSSPSVDKHDGSEPKIKEELRVENKHMGSKLIFLHFCNKLSFDPIPLLATKLDSTQFLITYSYGYVRF